MYIRGKSPGKTYILLAIAGFIGFLLVLCNTSRFGPGITHDSVAYIFTAKSLLAGKGYAYFGYPSPFIQWPPLFPTMLAAANAVGIGIPEASRYINAVTFGLIVFFSGLWLFKRVWNQLFTAAGTAALLLSAPLIWVSQHLWTEPLFILFLLLFLIVLERYLENQKPAWLVWASVFAALACLDRYMGVMLVFTGCIFLLFQRKKFSGNFRDTLIFGVISVFPTVIWIIRNYIVSSTLVGMRTPALVTLKHNLRLAAVTVASWLLPLKNFSGFLQPGLHTALRVFTALAALTLLAGVILTVVPGLWKLHAPSGISGWVKERRFPLAMLLCFIVIYSIYMIASATRVAFDPIGDRYMIPIYVPVILLAFLLFDGMACVLAVKTGKKKAQAVIVVALCVWLAYPLAGVVMLARDSLQNGAGGYSTATWMSNGLIEYLKQNKTAPPVYSNYPDAIYALTGIEAHYTPKKEGLAMYGFEQFRKAVEKEESATLVWFERGMFGTIYNTGDLEESFDLEEITSNVDGTVYRISRSGDTPSPHKSPALRNVPKASALEEVMP